MNKNFFETNELNGYNLLQYLNKSLHINELGKTPEKTFYDASGYTSTTNDNIIIELKKRNQSVTNDLNTISGVTSMSNKEYTASTIYIEEHKLAELYLHSTINKAVPLYINFLNGGYVYLFNLNKLKSFPKRVKKSIWSKGYEKMEYEHRYELPLSEAWIYHITPNESKLIRKPEIQQ